MLLGWQHLTPQDRENILKGIEDNRVYGGPYHLEFDWADRCNSRCFFCSTKGRHSGRSIPWARARELLEEAVDGGLRSIRLSGGGEPTLHDNFSDLMRLLRGQGIVLDNLTTNGILLGDQVIDELMSMRVSEVIVSLNYPTRETWSQGMGSSERNFECVIANVRRLGEARRGNPDFGALVLQFYVYKHTMRLIRECYELGRELGADRIAFRELGGIDPALYFSVDDVPDIVRQMSEIIGDDRGAGTVESQLESHGIGAEIDKIYYDLRAEPEGPEPVTGEPFDESVHYCYIGWYSMTIMGNQDVFPCCFLQSNGGYRAIDNLDGKSLGGVWRGPALARLRCELRDFSILQRQVPLFDRRVKTIVPSCATHDLCPLTRSMCDEPFYDKADRRLQAVRARPSNQLWRFCNRAGRYAERRLRDIR